MPTPALPAACVIDGDSLAVGGVLEEKWCRGGVEVRISGIDAPELMPSREATCERTGQRKKKKPA